MIAAHVIGNRADFLDPAFLFARRPPVARRTARPSDPGGDGTARRFRPPAAPFPDLDKLYTLTVVGDSMRPDFEPGRLLIVDRSLVPVPGDFVIAKSEEVTLFRKLVRSGGKDCLQPLNPAYPTRPLHGFKVVGVVAWSLVRCVSERQTRAEGAP